jgi:hypothetical protein
MCVRAGREFPERHYANDAAQTRSLRVEYCAHLGASRVYLTPLKDAPMVAACTALDSDCQQLDRGDFGAPVHGIKCADEQLSTIRSTLVLLVTNLF